MKHLAVTTENYEEALQILDERYGNVEIKNTVYFKEWMIAIPSITKIDTLLQGMDGCN